MHSKFDHDPKAVILDYGCQAGDKHFSFYKHLLFFFYIWNHSKNDNHHFNALKAWPQNRHVIVPKECQVTRIESLLTTSAGSYPYKTSEIDEEDTDLKLTTHNRAEKKTIIIKFYD